MTERARCYDCGQDASEGELAPRVVWVDGGEALVLLCQACARKRAKLDLNHGA
jgi:hypothetical protein